MTVAVLTLNHFLVCYWYLGLLLNPAVAIRDLGHHTACVATPDLTRAMVCGNMDVAVWVCGDCCIRLFLASNHADHQAAKVMSTAAVGTKGQKVAPSSPGIITSAKHNPLRYPPEGKIAMTLDDIIAPGTSRKSWAAATASPKAPPPTATATSTSPTARTIRSTSGKSASRRSCSSTTAPTPSA